MAPRTSAPPSQARLPDGFAVVLDARTRRLGNAALLGGAPLRLLRLSTKARQRLSGTDRLLVTDPTSAALARALLDAGVAHPRPATDGDDTDSGSTALQSEVTVVIPVRDRPDGLAALLATVRGTASDLGVLVVDDGSRDDAAVRTVCERYNARVVRHRTAGGPARARNTGLAAARTPYVALLDSDCLPQPGWLPRLRRHLDDPLVAAVAPRIVAAGAPADQGRIRTWITAYERVASALDLGPREGPVHPHGAVPYVPSAALLVRRQALGGGYDETMHVAEDVDLVWRLVEAGWRVRYEPAATVAHDHRTQPLAWARRRAFYGTGAAPLAARHAASVAPLVLSPASGLAWALLLLRRPWGPIAAAGVLA
ncbi:MAG: mycofactocin biosynthesis glycosyltransferase MftF, partial [Geodermatophilaceae bacterium]|nr:mycofactocin biosynthesis glycosyltransferase MftF [Geodermatophilaceae bacterium]